jgi:hypothetical protein
MVLNGDDLYSNRPVVLGNKKMRRGCHCSLFLATLVLALQGCASFYFHKAVFSPPPPRSLTLSDNPMREYWAGIIFNGSKIGFSHFRLAPAAEEEKRFDIQSEAYFRIRFLMLDKKINLRGFDRVADDLSLICFDYAFDIDGNQLSLNGQRLTNQLAVTVRSRGESTRQVISLGTQIYPASAIALYPFLHGLEVGRRYHYTVYDGQTQKLAPVDQAILAYEESQLFRGPAFKIRTRFQGGTVTTWMNDHGESLLETSLNGVVISVLESEDVARKYLAQAALNKDENLLEFSLIKCDTVISDPDRIHTLTVHISGLSDSVTLPNDDRQACTRGGNGSICRLSPLSEAGNQDPVLPDVETLSRYLAPTIAISARHPQISSLAKKIVAGADGDPQRIRALIDWIRQHIAREPVDVFTALDVLKGGRAECQGHALLYAAFARTLDIPTRIVNGIVYAPEFRGFLYHSWNESIVDGRWVAVDPTFGQIPVDATHIKLLEGQNLSDLIPLVDMIGKLKVRILSAE